MKWRRLPLQYMRLPFQEKFIDIVTPNSDFERVFNVWTFKLGTSYFSCVSDELYTNWTTNGRHRHRPKVLNAINVEVIAELSAIDIVSADDNVKVVVITGKGERSFCAGADIRYVANIDPIEAERYASSVHTMLNKREIRKACHCRSWRLCFRRRAWDCIGLWYQCLGFWDQQKQKNWFLQENDNSRWSIKDKTSEPRWCLS